jgi:hypothetical protein
MELEIPDLRKMMMIKLCCLLSCLLSCMPSNSFYQDLTGLTLQIQLQFYPLDDEYTRSTQLVPCLFQCKCAGYLPIWARNPQNFCSLISLPTLDQIVFFSLAVWSILHLFSKSSSASFSSSASSFKYN